MVVAGGYIMAEYKKKENIEVLSDELIQILDNINVAVFVDDADGYEIWLNKAAEELYAIDRDEIIGRNMFDLEEEGVFVPSLTARILKKESGMDIIHENKAGKKLLTSGVPLMDEENRIRRVVTTSVDITRLVTLEQELQKAHDALDQLSVFEGLDSQEVIMSSMAMREVIQLTKKLAQIDSTILITGESGTGKGVIAKILHENGNRRSFPFVQINCGAIPDNLMESELFGYESGSFTGSRKGGKKGLFEVAQHGTIFLDEIGELPQNLQVKILQALQNKQIQKIGATETIPVDARIIAASNKNLEEMVSAGTFREDLFYRLNVVPIYIPPLRERPEDILSMIKLFLKRNNEKFLEKKVITSNAIADLLKYSWPGNVSELENIIERLVITTQRDTILPENLPIYIRHDIRNQTNITNKTGMSYKEAMDLLEKQLLQNALGSCKTTRQIGDMLKLDQSTIVRKLKKHNLKI